MQFKWVIIIAYLELLSTQYSHSYINTASEASSHALFSIKIVTLFYTVLEVNLKIGITFNSLT